MDVEVAMETIGLATAAGLVWAVSGRSPASLLATGLLHARAAWMLAGVAARAAWGVRHRYQECVETVRRSG